jgi:outer membrane lipoprotein SlyB
MNIPVTHVSKSRAHPMLIIAGIAVVLFCATGTAAIMGWIPNSIGSSARTDALALNTPASLAEPASKKLPQQRVAATPARHSQPRSEPVRAAAAVQACWNCGVVESTREITSRGNGSGLGAAGGAVVGGLLGNQVGGGHGKEAMTVLGAVGGAFAGNQIEKQVKAIRSYETAVRMSDGSIRAIAQATPPEWRSGDNVKIVDGIVRSNG